MAQGREYTSGQRKIINRYYDNIDTILVTRLSEISTDMALAMGNEKKLDRLWKRATQALEKIRDKNDQPDPEILRIIAQRDLVALAKLVSKLSK